MRLVPSRLALLLLAAPFILGPSPAPAAPRITAPGTPPAPPVAPAVPAAPAAPTLLINDADPTAKAAVHLDALKIHVTLNAPLAETTVTLTFKNTLDRPLEGTLEFPLPENAAVVGYALDVPAGSGTLVEGVCVEKERARRIFDTEQRARIDPGLVEHTRGNNYRTRVHPIPAGGTRTIQLTYVSDMVDVTLGTGRLENLNRLPTLTSYSLPLHFTAGNPLRTASIRIDAPGLSDPASLAVQGLPTLAFENRNGTLVAEKSFSNITLAGHLTVTQPLSTAAVAARLETRARRRSVENILNPANAPGTAEHYFMISAVVSEFEARTLKPTRIGIIWDTSLSRANADRTAELATLRDLAARTPEATFHVVSTEGKPLKDFPVRDINALLTYLQDLPCDGALSIDGLRQKLQTDRIRDSNQPSPNFYLFFSDGLVTLGERTLGPADAPVHTLSSDPRADHTLLQTLARQTGGRYFNLQRTAPVAAADALVAPAATATLTWEQDKPLLSDVFPAASVPITPGQRITFTGKLLAPSATATLTIAGQTQQITLTRQAAAPTTLISRFWAQQKAADLSADPTRHHDALLALGKEFSIVTPVTSLLVLETADQYVRHRVVPPQSAKDLYTEFVKQIEAQSAIVKQEEEQKIDHVLALWEKRVEWWNTRFTPPTREQLAAARKKAESEHAARGASGSINSVPGEASQAQSPSASPAAPGPAQRAALDAMSAESSRLERHRTLSISGMQRQGKSAADEDPSTPQPTITIKPWSPDTPYLRAIKAAPPAAAYTTYLGQRKAYFDSPAFYLDCANFFLDNKQPDLAIRILTNIAQLRLEDAALLRAAAYRLLQIGEHRLAIDLFEQVKTLRPDEPQSWRDLALAYAARATARASLSSTTGHAPVLSDYARALELLHHVVMNKWDRFDEIEVIALTDANSLWTAAARFDTDNKLPNLFNPRLVKNLDCDMRILLTWDADNTDIDLHVLEPTSETANYSHNLTLSGGLVSRDFTQGYGPEEYVIRNAPRGPFKIMANYYGSQQQSIQGPVTVQATVITNFGRPNEARQALTLRLTEQKETVTIGEVQFQPAPPGGRP